MNATVQGASESGAAVNFKALAEEEGVLEVMRACHDRRLEREGIPMVLALIDERGDIPEGSARQRTEGAFLASVVDDYRAELVPWSRDDDENALITVTQVLSVVHPLPEEGVKSA